MKITVSLPASLYFAAEETAKSMGLPRSQLFAKALEEFIARHRNESITEKYNEIYSNIHVENFTQVETITVQNLRDLTENDTW